MMKKKQLSFFLIALLFFMNIPSHIGLAETNESIQVEGIIGRQQVIMTDEEDNGKNLVVDHKELSKKTSHEMPKLGSDTTQAQVFLMLGLLCLSGAIFAYCTKEHQGKDGNRGTTKNATKKVES